MKKIFILTILAVMTAWGAKGAWAAGPFPTPMTNGTFGPVGQVTPNSGTGEYEIYNAVNQLLGTSYSSNAQIDPLEYTGNTSVWEQSNSGGYAVIGLGAANTNTLEVYNASTPSVLINPIGGGFTGNGAVGNGTIGNPYIGASAVFSTGTQFGFAINTVGSNNINIANNGSNNTWYSDPTLNSDAMDHMLVYNLSSLNGSQVYVYDPSTKSEELVTLDDPYLLSFEDLPLNNNGQFSDMDYNDLDVLVSGVTPVTAPVPEPMTWVLLCVGLLAMAAFRFRHGFGF